MNKKRTWVFLALVLVIGLVSVLLKPLPRPKLRPQRIQSVNHLASVSFNLPSTNAPATTATNH